MVIYVVISDLCPHDMSNTWHTHSMDTHIKNNHTFWVIDLGNKAENVRIYEAMYIDINAVNFTWFFYDTLSRRLPPCLVSL